MTEENGTYCLCVVIPKKITNHQDRSDWISEISEYFFSNPERYQFQGALEGEVLPRERILDAAEAPQHRDLVKEESRILSRFYFETEKGALFAKKEIEARLKDAEVIFEKTKNEDWNKKWRESFKGVDLTPFWSIVPVWSKDRTIPENHLKILMNPSLGFGTGEHSTTQLCLNALGQMDLRHKKVLDFGSGSGILAVAAALKGADVVAVEIDEMALQSSVDCAKINGVQNKIEFRKILPAGAHHFDVIVANILKNVLLKFSSNLKSHLSVGGSFILSGLLESDLPEIEVAFKRSSAHKWKRSHQGEWWCLQDETTHFG